jgi:hypothetical protein
MDFGSEEYENFRKLALSESRKQTSEEKERVRLLAIQFRKENE